MAVRVGINGFGRIGRNVFRAAYERGADIEWVAVNDLVDPQTIAHLLKYDSNYGPFPGEVEATDDRVHASTATRSRCSAERDPAALPWGELGVDVVIESTGLFTDRENAAKHLEAGAKKVVISAPATNPDVTVVLGVNFDEVYDRASHHVDLERVVHDQLPGAGREGAARHGRDQARPDDDDPRLHRRPAPAGHAAPRPAPRPRGGGQPDPGLDRRREGDRAGDPRAQRQAPRLRGARAGPDRQRRRPDRRGRARDERRGGQRRAQGGGRRPGARGDYLDYTEDPIVSSDIVRNPASSIFDSQLTAVMDGTMVKVVAWYDNEWGYSNRVVDLVQRLL